MSSSGGPANDHRQAHRVDAVRRPARSPRSTPLPQRLATSPCRWLMTMPWFSSARERLGEVDVAQVVQHLGEEPRVQQVQDRVLDAADVLVDRHPLVAPRAGSNGDVVVVRRAEAQEVPGASRRRCPSCRCRASAGPPQLGQVDVDPVGRPRPAARCPSASGPGPRRSGSTHRQLVVGHRRPRRRPGSARSGSGCPSSAAGRSASRAAGS